METIYVTGYPRSGNSWTSQLLGDILHCEVGGMYNAKPLCAEGRDRGRGHYIAQLHLKPWPPAEDANKAVPNAWRFYPDKWASEKIVHVVRDPRDVVISAWSYWNIDSVSEALDCVGMGLWPVKMHWSWATHVEKWLNLTVPVRFLRYEDLHENPEHELRELCYELELPCPEHRLKEAIERQSFAKKREQVERDGAGRPYGRTIQLKHMRKGIVGDWRNHFTEEMEERARGYFTGPAERLGYELS